MIKEAFVKKTSCLMMTMLLAVSGFFFVSCGSDSDGDGGGTAVVVSLKNVKITGTAKVGNKLTAVAATTDGKSGADVSGVTYQWYSADSEDTADSALTAIAGATSREFEVTDTYVGKYIKVSAKKGSDTEYSDFKGPVTITSVKSVTVTGTAKVGETLTATVTDTDGTDITTNENVSYQWYSSASVSSGFTAISGATSSSYVLQASDANKYVKVSATMNNTTVNSEPTDAVYIATIKEVKANGDAKVGATLTAVATDTDGSTDGTGVTFEWFVSDTNSIPENAVSIATESSYTIPAAYYDKYLIVKATKNGGFAVYPTTKVQAGALVDTGTFTYDDSSVESIVVTLNGDSADAVATLDNSKFSSVTELKDATSNADVAEGAASFPANSLTLASSKNLTITVNASGYNPLTKDVFVTVTAAAPTATNSPELLSGDDNQAQILQGCVKFDLTGDNAAKAGKYQYYSNNAADWITLTATNAEINVGNAETINVRVAPYGTAGSEGYIAPSEAYEITIQGSNRGTKPSIGVTSVTISGDIEITQNGTVFTAADVYKEYAWAFSETVPDGTLTLSNENKTATVDETKLTVTGSYYLTVTAKLNGHEYTGTVTITK